MSYWLLAALGGRAENTRAMGDIFGLLPLHFNKQEQDRPCYEGKPQIVAQSLEALKALYS